MSLLAASLMLGACNGAEEAKTDTVTKTEQAAKTDTATEQKAEDKKQVASLADPRLQEVPENTNCEMCNMVVYTKDHEMGKFSAQAIKADGSIAFYDDIGCLLNAELKFNEKNEKFVRDFNTLEWVKVDDATIVKTDLKTPMNWGYAFFVKKEDAEKYIADNKDKGYTIEKFQTVVDAAKERYEKKMNMQQPGGMNAPQDGTGAQNMNGHNMHDGHNH